MSLCVKGPSFLFSLASNSCTGCLKKFPFMFTERFTIAITFELGQ